MLKKVYNSIYTRILIGFIFALFIVTFPSVTLKNEKTYKVLIPGYYCVFTPRNSIDTNNVKRNKGLCPDVIKHGGASRKLQVKGPFVVIDSFFVIIPGYIYTVPKEFGENQNFLIDQVLLWILLILCLFGYFILIGVLESKKKIKKTKQS